MINRIGIKCKKKHYVQYVYFPEPDGNMEYSPDSEHSDMTVIARDDARKPEDNDQPVLLTQADINDITGNLNHSKSLSSFWFHVSKRNICWHKEPNFTAIERKLRQFFTFQGK